MKFRLTSLILIFICSISCIKKNNKKGNIVGDLSNIKNDFDAVVIEMQNNELLGDTLKISDTVLVKNGKFEYSFYIQESKLTWFKLLKNNKIEGNLVLKAKQKRFGKDLFYGNIYIGNENILIDHKFFKKQIYNNSTIYKFNLEGAKENEIYQSLWDKTITKNMICENPGSFALLHNLFWQKENFNNKELFEMMDLFSDELKQSTSFGTLKNYLEKKIDLERNGYTTRFQWNDIHGKSYNFKTVLNNKKYTLLVFWASWCGPCRGEIPELKKFNKKYGNQVSLVSLSIDDNFDQWKKAVEKEQMPWHNLSGLPKGKKAIKKEYNISAVPNLILLDKNGKMLMNNLNELDKIKEYIDTH